MSILRRTFVSLYAKVDNLVGDIENHDALVKAAIGEQKQKIAAAKIELRRLEKYQNRLNTEVQECDQNEDLWTQRASVEAKRNEEKALLCLQRRQAIRDKKQRLLEIQKEHKHSVSTLKNNINECESDLNAMIQKHQLMRARQSTSEVMSVMESSHTNHEGGVDATFDRWELQLAKHEHDVLPVSGADDLEQSYLDKENEDQLRHELAELIKDSKLNP